MRRAKNILMPVKSVNAVQGDFWIPQAETKHKIIEHPEKHSSCKMVHYSVGGVPLFPTILAIFEQYHNTCNSTESSTVAHHTACLYVVKIFKQNDIVISRLGLNTRENAVGKYQ